MFAVFADLEDGDDRFDGSLSQQDLLVAGGGGEDWIQTGNGADIVFGDKGQPP